MQELGIEVEITNNEEAALAKLMAGRIDSYPCNPVVTMENIKKLYPDRIDDVVFLQTPLTTTEQGIIYAKDFPNASYYLDKFEKGLKLLKESGEYNEIIRKHGFDYIISEE